MPIKTIQALKIKPFQAKLWQKDKIVAMVPEDKVSNKGIEDKPKTLVAEDKIAAMVKDDSTNVKKSRSRKLDYSREKGC